jgi:putative transcriptional regulator
MFDSLAPGFLLASPPLGDPNFDRTVVLLALHSEEGALGFVVNRVAPVTVGELLEHAGYDKGHQESSPVWIGGPVQPQSGWVPALLPGDGIIGVGPRLRVSSSRDAFDRLAAAATEGRVQHVRQLVMLGYSGWAPQQLESEIARGAWLPTPLDESILFEVDAAQRWEKAYALLGLSPTNVMSMRSIGSA